MNEEVTKLKGNKYLSTKAIVHKNKLLSDILDELLGKAEMTKLTIQNYLKYGWEANGFNQIFKNGDVVTLSLSIRFGTANHVLTLPERI